MSEFIWGVLVPLGMLVVMIAGASWWLVRMTVANQRICLEVGHDWKTECRRCGKRGERT